MLGESELGVLGGSGEEEEGRSVKRDSLADALDSHKQRLTCFSLLFVCARQASSAPSHSAGLSAPGDESTRTRRAEGVAGSSCGSHSEISHTSRSGI